MNIAIDTHLAKPLLVDFIREEVKKYPCDNAIIGISGGIDSAVVAYLRKMH